uniref:Peroxidase n=1 Tax=Clastoptera arizonana TaxID=38151 RepID=A0A1B6C8P6_9HEMI
MMTNQYDAFLNPSTLNSFTTAAYRSFHSMIPGTMSLISEKLEEVNELKLEDFFFKPNIVQIAGNLDNFLRGLALQAAQTLDTFFSSSITKLLFKSNRKFGTDLESIDIQRGRDHGLAPYNEFRVACGFPRANSFEELKDVMPPNAIQNLKSKYNSVDDVDLFVGGIMENLVPKTLVGPTFQCIIGEQFKRWRNGDRFYYEFGGFPGSFNQKQVREIRKVTLATIFCRNGDNITRIQPNVFKHSSTENRVLPCSKISKMNLDPWRGA